MMAISNVSMNTTPKVITPTRESRNLESQLTNEQQRLNRLSSSSNMTAAEKEKERREIQRQIAELNRKLELERQEEKEKARKAATEQEQKKIVKEELLEKTNNKDKTDSKYQINETGPTDSKDEKSSLNNPSQELPVVTIKNLLTASAMTKQNAVIENSSQKAEGQQNILQAEIQSDTLYGTDTTAKKEALSDLRQKEEIQIKVLYPQQEKDTPIQNPGSKIIIRE